MPKISGLPEITVVAPEDQLPIRDVSANTTKRISLAALYAWLQSVVGWITTAMLADGAATDAKWRNGVVFRARRTTQQGIGANAVTKFVLDTTQFNIGNGYSTATGEFTAPVAGIYEFKAHATLLIGASPDHAAYFYKNGVEYSRPHNGQYNYPEAQSADLIQLAIGDKVDWRIHNRTAGFNTEVNTNAFSGLLVTRI